MTTTTSERRTFADKLRAELDRRSTESGAKLGNRGVARLLVTHRPDRDLEQTRRAVIRWLAGATPTQANRDEVTDALGMERGSLDPDAEEADQVATNRARRRAERAFGSVPLPDLLQMLAEIAGGRR